MLEYESFKKLGRKYEYYYFDGDLHRDDGPAVIIHSNGCLYQQNYYTNGMLYRIQKFRSSYTRKTIIMSDRWFDDDTLLHRDDGPAYIKYKHDGFKFEEWFEHGKLHRKDGPAVICYRADGSICSERYYINNNLRKCDGPSIIEYWNNDLVKSKKYLNNYGYHREDGPAIVYYDRNGINSSEEWYYNSKRHRLDGPAVKQGSDIQYYIFGYNYEANCFKSFVKTRYDIDVVNCRSCNGLYCERKL